VGIGAAYVSVRSIDGIPFQHTYRVDAIVPADAPIVRAGDEVRIAGERAGEVRAVSLDPHGRRVTMAMDSDAVGRDATAAVHLRGLAGAVYVDLNPGHFSSNPAPSGWTISRSHTSTGTQLTDVVSAFHARARASLRRTLTAYGSGMAGRGIELNQALADLPPTLRQGTPLLQALSPKPGELAATVGGVDQVLRGLGSGPPATLADLITAGRTTFEATVAERGALEAGLKDAPGTIQAARQTLPVATPVLRDLQTTSSALAPVTARLAKDLPDVNRLLGRADEVDQLAAIARAADPALRSAGPALERLQPAAQTLGPLAAALEPLAAYVSRYRSDVFAGPHGFTTWGRFRYDQGQAPGHRAVRFTPVFTCPAGRDPYPAPGQASTDRKPSSPGVSC
jgi:ABC-type transporter Mla subunit MlaD